MTRTSTTWLPAALAGGLGGFLGFFIAENTVVHIGDNAGYLGRVLGTALLIGVLSVPLTATLVVAENLWGLRGRWNRDLVKILLPALVVGAVAGGLAQIFYSWLLALTSTGQPTRFMRALAWTLLGAGVGLLLGYTERSFKKALRGLLGGAAGGFVGGLLFDSFTVFSLGEGDTGTVSRAVGFTVLGGAIGLMLRVTQDLLKSAWLIGTSKGPYEGKQYILSKNLVTIGRSDANDIALYHDPSAPLQAGKLLRQGGLWFWEGENILINGQSTRKKPLKSGDRLRIGQNDFVFQEKRAVEPDELQDRYLLHSNTHSYPLPPQFSKLTLGQTGDVQIPEDGVQDRHAELQVKQGQLYVLALGEVSVNDQSLQKGSALALKAGDIIKLAQVELALLKDR